MKKYEYVRIHIGKLFGAGKNDHRTIINEYAQKGYRYVGYVPAGVGAYGSIKVIDLVFEIDC